MPHTGSPPIEHSFSLTSHALSILWTFCLELTRDINHFFPAADPPEFELELEDLTAHEGEDVSLDVVVQSSAECQLEWFKDGVDVQESDRHSFVDNGDGQYSLVIQTVEEDDTGEYCCVAENPGGRATCAGYLTVEEDIGDLGE